mmetsp:Transcript_544/g.3855  ORF Transcript_544/g.3855 Transcript_544/m.3855 type:complete len:297 (+) Transcript_544:1131-2021(+)
MRRDGLSFWGVHDFCVPMIRGDEESSVVLLACFCNLTDALVCFSTSNDGLLKHSGVPNHVRRSKVTHDELVFSTFNGLAHFICNSLGTHFWLKIVGRDFWRWHHAALLIFELILFTSIEKKCNMRVLLRLRHVELLESLLRDPFRQGVFHLLRRKYGIHRKLGFILREHVNLHIFTLAIRFERWLQPHGFVDFSHPVCTVVEEDNCVTIPHLSIRVTHDGLQKFVGLVLLVTFFNGIYWGIRRLCSFVSADGVEGNLDTFPTFVSIHGVVSSNDSGQGTILHLFQFVQQHLRVFGS